MTHFVVWVMVSSEASAESEAAKLLEPYCEELQVEPYKRSIEGEQLKRMQEQYKTSDPVKLVTKIPDWFGGDTTGVVEDGNLFYWSTYNPNSKWDWYAFDGRWGRFLEATSVVAARKPLNPPVAMLLPDGSWIEIGEQGWWGFVANVNDQKRRRAWARDVRNALRAHPDCWVIGVDAHI